MKIKNPKKRSAPKGNNIKSSINQDPFFSAQSNKRSKVNLKDDYIDSGDSDDENGFLSGEEKKGSDEEQEIDEFADETVNEKKHRLAKSLLDKLRAIDGRQDHDEADDDGEDRFEREGERDTLIANKLLKEQLEDSGRLRRAIASRVQKPETVPGFENLVKHRHSVTAVCLSDDELKGFSASKDGTILQWDIDTGKGEKYKWPTDETLRRHGARNPEGKTKKHSKQVLALAVSSDGRYLASGGLDRHVHLWDTRTREHIQAFPGHRGPVSCLTFRQGASELFSGSFDRSIKIWNVEDRAYLNTLFGLQSEVLTVDCLRKERVLAAGRDRTLQLFKVPEESRLVFRASASSLECCCFIDNDDFLSGSDDGNIELWTIQKKKPLYTVKNAHTLLTNLENAGLKDNGNISSGHNACSWVSSVAVCRGSDLAASGAGNGAVRLWCIDSAPKASVRPLYDLPLIGFVNSLAFAKSGRFLVAGVGEEPRLGRWGRVSGARNGVAIQRLKFS
ncbi:U3 snoRNP-associated protein-like EMB2271 [Euphorbia peplus]|nr:U3 snoRNP-associated protein-like EMB2271 [Euphorbia peplus]